MNCIKVKLISQDIPTVITPPANSVVVVTCDEYPALSLVGVGAPVALRLVL